MRKSLIWPTTAFIFLLLIIILMVLVDRQREYIEKVINVELTERSRFNRRIINDDEPFIFVGGMPRSGTTLMRSMLDAHERIRCGEETMVITAILAHRSDWMKKTKLIEGSGLSAAVIDSGVSAFISEIIVRHGDPAPRYCNKDPFTLHHNGYLKHLYPNAKFLLMIRDPRATIHSILTRNIPVYGFNRSDTKQCFGEWNNNVENLVRNCRDVGDSCMMVHYESLVLSPREQMVRILEFLDEPWSENVVNHQKFIGDQVKLNPHEFSTSQVVKEVNKKALDAWKGYFDIDVLSSLSRIAPVMASLGYDPDDYEPDYEKWILEPKTN